jgi:hypothetical protein
MNVETNTAHIIHHFLNHPSPFSIPILVVVVVVVVVAVVKIFVYGVLVIAMLALFPKSLDDDGPWYPSVI